MAITSPVRSAEIHSSGEAIALSKYLNIAPAELRIHTEFCFSYGPNRYLVIPYTMAIFFMRLRQVCPMPLDGDPVKADSEIVKLDEPPGGFTKDYMKQYSIIRFLSGAEIPAPDRR